MNATRPFWECARWCVNNPATGALYGASSTASSRANGGLLWVPSPPGTHTVAHSPPGYLAGDGLGLPDTDGPGLPDTDGPGVGPRRAPGPSGHFGYLTAT